MGMPKYCIMWVKTDPNHVQGILLVHDINFVSLCLWRSLDYNRLFWIIIVIYSDRFFLWFSLLPFEVFRSYSHLQLFIYLFVQLFISFIHNAYLYCSPRLKGPFCMQSFTLGVANGAFCRGSKWNLPKFTGGYFWIKDTLKAFDDFEKQAKKCMK